MKVITLALISLVTSAVASPPSPLLLRETAPAYTPSMRWTTCRIFADRMVFEAELDGVKEPTRSAPIRFTADVRSAADIATLAESARKGNVTKIYGPTDIGHVHHRAYDGSRPLIVLKSSGTEEEQNHSEAARKLVALIDLNCPAL